MNGSTHLNFKILKSLTWKFSLFFRIPSNFSENKIAQMIKALSSEDRSSAMDYIESTNVRFFVPPSVLALRFLAAHVAGIKKSRKSLYLSSACTYMFKHVVVF